MKEVRITENKLVCKYDFDKGIVEIVKNGWVITINMQTKEVTKSRKA